MERPFVRVGALVLPLALGVLASPLPAQEPAAGFAEALDVRVVNVDVLVTDADGRPVRGLRRDDFRLFEDGRRVQITNFFESVQTIGEPAARMGTADTAPAETARGGPPLPGEPATLVL